MCVILPNGEIINKFMQRLKDDFEVIPNTDGGREFVITTPFTRSDGDAVCLSVRQLPLCNSLQIDDDGDSANHALLRGGDEAGNAFIAAAKRIARKNGVQCNDAGLLYANFDDANADEALMGVLQSAMELSALAYGVVASESAKPDGLRKAGQRELVVSYAA